MSRKCAITGKTPMVGNNVSHAKNRTKRRFDINLHSKRFYSEEQNRFIRIRVSAAGIRLIDKLGFDAAYTQSMNQTKSGKVKGDQNG